jgi:hypothetical protein
LVLGDNIFYGQGFVASLRRAANSDAGAVVFTYWEREPSQYGVIDFAPDGAVRAIIEKPTGPPRLTLDEIAEMAAALHAEPRSGHRVYGTAVAVLPSKRNFVVFRCGIQTRIWSSSLEKDHLTHRDR